MNTRYSAQKRRGSVSRVYYGPDEDGMPVFTLERFAGFTKEIKSQTQGDEEMKMIVTATGKGRPSRSDNVPDV